MVRIPEDQLTAAAAEHLQGVLTYARDICMFYYNVFFHLCSGGTPDLAQLKTGLRSELDGRTLMPTFNTLLGKNIKRKEVQMAFVNQTQYFKPVYLIKANTIKALLRHFLYDRHELIQQILIGRPEELVRLHHMLFKNYRILFVKANRCRKPLKYEFEASLKDILIKIFDYNWFSKDKSCQWDAYKLTESLSVGVCPYCNRNYVFTVTKNNKRIVRPQLDHFFCQSKFPLFSVSLYNLIPTCEICNKKKLNEVFTLEQHIHPYLEGFDPAAVFKTNFNWVNLDRFDGDPAKVRVDLHIERGSQREKIKRNVQKLAIREIYEKHNDIAAEILYRAKNYPDSQIEEIARLLNGASERMVSEKEIFHQIFYFPETEEDIRKRSLGKLYCDIIKDLRRGSKYL